MPRPHEDTHPTSPLDDIRRAAALLDQRTLVLVHDQATTQRITSGMHWLNSLGIDVLVDPLALPGEAIIIDRSAFAAYLDTDEGDTDK